LSAANCADRLTLAGRLDTIPPIKRPLGRPRRRPAKLHADKGYDAAHCRAECRARSIIPRIARRTIDSSEQLGRYRGVVEITQPHCPYPAVDGRDCVASLLSP